MSRSRKQKTYKLSFNAPIVIAFALISVGAFILEWTTGVTNGLLFSVYRSSLRDVFTYFRFVGHVFGHQNLSHILNNMMMLLLLGPIVEEHFGHGFTALSILAVALATGIVHFILFPHTALLGASGVVFAFIIMSSAIGLRKHEIPITFILVAILYLGEQIVDALFVKDSISQLTHIIGGIVGGVMAIIDTKRQA